MTSLSSRRASRVATAIAGFAIAALALAGCASGSDTPAAESSGDAAAGFGDLTVQLSWIKNEEFAGEFFADSEGFYTDAGFDSVTLVPGPSTGAAELISGSADVALSDAVSIGSVVASEGAPLKIIGTTYQKNPFTVLSLKDGGDIATPEDLIGKKIGVQDSNTALFKALLAANGIEESELTIVPVQYDPAPLINGEVDGFIAYLTNEAITVAEIKGWTMAVNDPEAGAKLAVEDYGKDLDLNLENSIAGATEQAEALVVSDETAENGLFTISEALQDATIKSLSGAGITLEASDLFDLSLLAEVYEENPDLIAYAG